jgi:hypothetical protein
VGSTANAVCAISAADLWGHAVPARGGFCDQRRADLILEPAGATSVAVADRYWSTDTGGVDRPHPRVRMGPRRIRRARLARPRTPAAPPIPRTRRDHRPTSADDSRRRWIQRTAPRAVQYRTPPTTNPSPPTAAIPARRPIPLPTPSRSLAVDPTHLQWGYRLHRAVSSRGVSGKAPPVIRQSTAARKLEDAYPLRPAVIRSLSAAVLPQVGNSGCRASAARRLRRPRADPRLWATSHDDHRC